jgi:hypothetical protein
MPYEEARAIVRAEVLKSSVEYRKWWLDNRPSRIPKNPNRAYHAVWQGWGDYLGTNNPFPCVRRKFRPYAEARAWAHTLGLTNKAQWFDYIRAGKPVPADVPRRPDIYYQKTKEWLTWKSYLGYKVADRVAVISETDHIIYIVQYQELPTNVYTIGITNEGKSGIITRSQELGFRIIAGYYHDKQSDWMSKISKYIRPYHVGNTNFICNNIAEVLSELSLHYLVVR